MITITSLTVLFYIIGCAIAFGASVVKAINSVSEENFTVTRAITGIIFLTILSWITVGLELGSKK